MIYGLFVGVDAYRLPVPPLFGCRNDVEALSALVTRRVPDAHLKTLVDAEATRQAVIDAFGSHLASAGPGDHAVFAFSGHGSQEIPPPELAGGEPDRLNETLVCADSRHDGVPDLADNELGALIAGVAANGADVVVLLDCCHSGSATRATRVRTAPSTATGPRALTTYLPAVQANPEAAESRHVCLSACESFQTAKEISIGGHDRGAFTVALEEALASLGPRASYAELLAALRGRIRDRVSDQDPKLSASGGFDPNAVVLDGGVSRSSLRIDFVANAWWLDAGAVDGLQAPTAAGAFVLDVHERGDAAAATVVATATVAVVEPGRARLDVSPPGALDVTRQYAGVVSSRPAGGLAVRLDVGTPAAIRDAIDASPMLVVADDAGPGRPIVVVDTTETPSIRRLDGTPLLGGGLASTATTEELIAALEHLARWFELRDRTLPGSTLARDVRIDVSAAHTLPSPVDGSIHLYYDASSGVPMPPRVVLRVENASNRRLCCGVVDLMDRWNAAVLVEPDWVPAGGTLDRVMRMSLPPGRDGPGATATDILKVVAAEREFSLDGWSLPPLDGFRADAAPSRSADRRLDLDVPTETPGGGGNWTTAELSLVTHR